MATGTAKVPLRAAPGGLREDVNIEELPQGAWLASLNYLTRQGKARPRPGYLTIGQGVGGRTLGHGFRGDPTDPFTIVTHLQTKAYGYIGGIVEDITGTWAESSADQPVRFSTFPSGGVTYIARVNMENPLDIWDGTGDFVSPTDEPPAALDTCVANNRILLIHTKDPDGTINPYQVRWSDFNDINSWPTGSANTAELAETNDTLVACAALSPLAAAIYKKSSVWLAQAVVAKNPFQFQLVKPTPGPLGPASLVIYRGAHYWIASDGMVYSFDGSQIRTLTGGASRTFLTYFDQSVPYRMHGFAIPLPEPEIWWVYPEVGTQETVRALCFNLATGAITPHTFADEISSGASWVVASAVTWDTEPSATWSGMAYASWTELLQLPTHPVAILGGADGEARVFGIAATDDGTDIPWTFTQPWRQPNPSGRCVVDGVRSYATVEEESLTVTVTFTASDNLGGQERTVVKTYDMATDDEHFVSTSEEDLWGSFVKVTQAGARASTTFAHHGALLTAWPRNLV